MFRQLLTSFKHFLGSLPKRISYKQNVLSFNSLSSTLASKDVLLILRLDCSGGYCQQYWALIPPSGVDQDSQIRTRPSSYNSGHSASSGSAENLRGQQRQSASHMVSHCNTLVKESFASNGTYQISIRIILIVGGHPPH
jgi:hypothetical protein